MHISATYAYDLESNLTKIVRHGLTDAGVYGVVNDITAKTREGRVTTVTDYADAPLQEGTLTGPVTGIAVPKFTHTYDASGNLITDATRGIDSIRYNVLNLPETVFFHSGYRLNYTYLADGTKLRETRRRPALSVGTDVPKVITHTIDYIGPYEIEDGVPARLQLPGGHMTLSDNVYHHYIPDYQGNILGVINTASLGRI